MRIEQLKQHIVGTFDGLDTNHNQREYEQQCEILAASLGLNWRFSFYADESFWFADITLAYGMLSGIAFSPKNDHPEIKVGFILGLQARIGSAHIVNRKKIRIGSHSSSIPKGPFLFD